MRPECAVIGGGIVGAMTTWRLATRGVRLAWFSGSAETSFLPASQAAGAMLCPFSELDESDGIKEVSAVVEERLRARSLYDSLLDELNVSAQSINWRSGIAVIASAKHSARDLCRLEWQTKVASNSGHSAESLLPSDLPFLSPDKENAIVGGIFLNNEASFDAMIFLQLIKDRIKIFPNVLICNQLIKTVSRRKPESEITIVTSSESLNFPQVILAAGVATCQLLEENTLRDTELPSIFGGKGVSLRGTTVNTFPFAVRTPNRGYSCGLHMVPNANGILYLGATNRLVTDRSWTTYPIVDEISQVLGGATRELSTTFRNMQINSFHVGYRPVTCDHRPLVGATACPGIMVATGTWRNGILLAPLLAEMIVAEFCDGKMPYERFSPLRIFSTSVPDEMTLAVYARDLLDNVIDVDSISTHHHSEMLAVVKYKLAEVFNVATAPPSSGVALARRLWKRAPLREVIPSIWHLIKEK